MKLLIAALCAASLLSAQEGPAWQVHAQATLVTQEKGPAPAPYQGANSLQPDAERATSFTSTLMIGLRPWAGTEFYLDVEGAAGKGVSSVLGMAGAPNGETYRVGNPEFRAAVARALIRQTFDLGGESQAVADDAHQLQGRRSSRRIVLHLGKYSVTDVFDANSYAHDPRTQFLNWTLMGHGAWDYPADTRGYTWGCAVEFFWDAWALRLGRFVEPKEANQMQMDPNFAHAHGDAVELEHDHELGGHPGAIRLMAYRNLAQMGSYAESLARSPQAPDITATRAPGREKQGLGLNLEQGLTQDLGAFLRASLNDGRNETWAFTEVDRSLSLGLSLKGSAWHRGQDTLGAAYVQNALSPEHRAYLAAGGLGFLLGDGALNYALEQILEAYYAFAFTPHFTASLDLQRAWHPAYNADRAAVTLGALRLHLIL